LLVGAAIAALGAPAVSLAADGAPATAVEELIVTANKREENLRDVPQSVTAIGGDLLQLRRAVQFEDYVNLVPGMNLVSSQPGSTRLMLRGVNTGGVSATLATYVDETPYGSVTGLANGAILTPDLDTFDMQRIEVLRGPQGTLYGASSLGGVLKFVTKAPDPGGYAGRIEVEGQDTKSASAGGSIKGLVNVPLGLRAAVRASAYYTDRPGFIDDPRRGATDVNDTTLRGGRIELLVNPTDAFTVRLSAVAQALRNDGAAIMDVNRLTLDPLYGDLTQSRTFSSTSDIDYRIYNLTADYDLGFANLTSATSFGTIRQNALVDGTAQLGGVVTSIFGQPLGVSVSSDLDQEKFTQEVRLASPAQTFEWLVGAFYTKEDNELDQVLSGISLTNPPAVATGRGGLQTVSLLSDYEEYAVFANVDYHVTEQFDVTVGARYSKNEQDVVQRNGGPLSGPTPSVFPGSSSEKVFTFAVAPKYKINESATIYARVAKGYRPGGPNALNPLTPAAVPRTFDSDSSINWEAGVKADFLERRVAVEVTAFYIDWDRLQLLANVGGFGVNTNGGAAKSTGVETSVTVVPATGLTIIANGAYTDAQLTKDTGALLGGKKGQRLPYSALTSGALSANYEYPLADDVSVFVGGALRFTGRRRSDFNAAFGQTSLPSYTVIDVQAGVDWKNFRAQVFAKNLGDERGILSFGGIGSTPNGGVQAGLIRPRTIGVALSASY
jgi:outer membrane receptor protein involved in Fe transport